MPAFIFFAAIKGAFSFFLSLSLGIEWQRKEEKREPILRLFFPAESVEILCSANIGPGSEAGRGIRRRDIKAPGPFFLQSK